MNLNDPIKNISGIGPKYNSLLTQASINTIWDFVLNIPYKYETYTNKKISELTAGENVIIKGHFSDIKNLYAIKSKFKITKGTFEDETGKIDITWFNQPYIANSVPTNEPGYISGKADVNPKSPRKLQIISPTWFTRKEDITESNSIIPVYSQSQGITSKWFAKKIAEVLTENKFTDTLDENFVAENNLVEFNEALKKIHHPQTLQEKDIGLSRIAFEELLYLHLRGLKTRTDWESKTKGVKISFSNENLTDYISKLPFELTNDQKNAATEIINDLNAEIPMNRLLQGDVGTGKTIVAFIAIYAMARENHNSIMIAPTQILAGQHFENAKRLFNNINVDIKLVTSDTKEIDFTNTSIPQIIIGTHAILHRMHKIESAGLIIIDEQHKFGVSQRSEIIDHFMQKQNQIAPNLLTMTATPIPRSLALAFYGELNFSLINEYPKNRKTVITWLINDKKRQASYDWIKKEITQHGTQVFVLCPFIEESEHEMFQEVKAAETEFEKIKTHFISFKVGLLHGRMKNAEKNEILEKFLNKQFDILVTTPVIEVGIDIPNANIIIIENPERMGLASIHQLRGRVGRSKDQGYCILISNSPDQSNRLKNLETVYNGNVLAELDLKLRGPGNMYGTMQHGFMNLKVADITDVNLIRKTKDAAIQVFANPQKYPKITSVIKNLKYIGDD